MNGLALVTGDWHWMNGSKADDARYEACERVLVAARSHHVQYFIWVGDIFDTWAAEWSSIVSHNRSRFHLLQEVLCGSFLFWCLGNHDWVRPGLAAQRLYQDVEIRSPFNVQEGALNLGEWTFEHGDRFDFRNNPNSPLRHIARVGTRVEAFLENHVWSGADDLIRAFVSPASIHNNYDLGIHKRANDWAERQGANLAMGHTHCPYDLRGPDWRVLNVGPPPTYGLIDLESGRGKLLEAP